jgi:hypothetical protein
MLHKQLSKYLDSIELNLSKVINGYIELWQEEILNSNRANVRVRIRYSNEYLLEINEAVYIENGSIKHLNYRYHFQDSNNELIFRYDNTPHFPNIDCFPQHKHEKCKILGATRPELEDVINEAYQSIIFKP